ncbi:MAG: hypothetical protein CMP76_09710 [Flavobacterium sp.]|uniref:hypothetical protein n=1 Tax=unclassified Flavobacterium TaxID=196869 RepID=UPI000C3ECFD6|nr:MULTISPECIES: hypothetical protein [unclassified Flavobacterium]MBF03558.1 hypothetical protein [Flavobacterium sp.]MCO6162950.1 hypothetical protein [Flavobacterium sp. NRK F7]
METNYQFKDLPFSTQLAIVSFSFGTILFLAHFIFPNYFPILVFGYIYLLIAILVNALTFFYLVYLFSKETDVEDLIIRILILLSNIPIAFLYAYVVLNTI